MFRSVRQVAATGAKCAISDCILLSRSANLHVLYVLNSSQAGEASAPYHENHGLCAAAVSTTSGSGHCRPREAVYKAVVV